jgi:hypothetical protein
MAMAAWSARSPARFFSSAVKSPREPNATINAPTARSWWINGSAMQAWSSLVSARARCRQRGSCCTSARYSGRRESTRMVPAMLLSRGTAVVRTIRPASSGPAQ